MVNSYKNILFYNKDFSFFFSVLFHSQRQIAMISEMVHSASLLHDDVIDQSYFRRGKPSVNVVWSQKKVSASYFPVRKHSSLHDTFINF